MIQLHDAFGRIDLSLITEEAVASLSEEQQQVLSLVIEATKDREAAEVRVRAAETDVRQKMAEYNAALEAHAKANPPPSRIDALRAAQEAFRKANS